MNYSYESLSRKYMESIVKNTSIFGESQFPDNIRSLGKEFETLIVCEVAVVIRTERLKEAKTVSNTNDLSACNLDNSEEETKETNQDLGASQQQEVKQTS